MLFFAAVVFVVYGFGVLLWWTLRACAWVVIIAASPLWWPVRVVVRRCR